VPTAVIIGVTVAVIGAVVIIVRHARGWGVPGAFLLEMEEREATQAAKDMVSEGGPVDPEGTTDPEEAPEPDAPPAPTAPEPTAPEPKPTESEAG
jgi:hypothetical protein